MDGGEPEREEEEDGYGWQECHQSASTLGDHLAYYVAVTQRCRSHGPYHYEVPYLSFYHHLHIHFAPTNSHLSQIGLIYSTN